MDGRFVAKNWIDLQVKIEEALRASGRTSHSVRMVGVSKKQSPEKMMQAVTAGLKILGENYVQDLQKKKNIISDLNVEWHFIGQLQRNKVRHVVGEVSLIHSVDRLNLAEEISRCAKQLTHPQDILIEVNVDQESSKSGVSLEKIESLLESLQKLEGIRVCGLMAMPSLKKTSQDARRSFALVREQRDRLTSFLSPGQVGHHLQELSMGTSQDFLEAIQEGATLVRLGTILFGERERI